MNEPSNVKPSRFGLIGKLLLALTLTGCIQIPSGEIVSGIGSSEMTSSTDTCGPTREFFPHRESEGLDPTSITLLNWNIQKKGEPLWEEESPTLENTSNLLLIQEAHLSPALRRMLGSEQLDWVISTAFKRNSDHAPIGVLTASQSRPIYRCALRAMEPLTRIPKTMLITEYPLRGMRQTLLVANVHAVNFSLGMEAYRAQLELLEAHMEHHEGPMILAGDFNTWRQGRLNALTELTDRLGLTPLLFETDARKRFAGFPLDHVFTRGLYTRTAVVTRVHSSDHNLIRASLAVSDMAPPMRSKL